MYCSSSAKTNNKFEVKGVHEGKYNCTQNFDWITSNEELTLDTYAYAYIKFYEGHITFCDPAFDCGGHERRW
jgi:hypothetical protein